MTSRRQRVVVYYDTAGQLRWRWVAANGRILADSAEGYTEPRHGITIARRLATALDCPLDLRALAPA